jgi:hypothetical protein
MRARIAALSMMLALGAAPSALSQTAALPTGSAARDGLSISTTAGYARLLFSFREATPISASVSDGVLTIRLGRSIDLTVENLIARLAPYVTSGRRDDDGLTYRLALANPVALHSSTQGNLTAIDLVPDSFKGVPPDLPAPPPPPKKEPPKLADLPTIKLRVGEYSNFTRLVFDWPQEVAYTVYPGQGRISVRFETAAKPDFSMLEMRSPPWVKSAGWRLDGAETVVDFETDPESAFHDFRDGNKIAIDVLAPKTDSSAYVPPGISSAPVNVTSLSSGAKSADGAPRSAQAASAKAGSNSGATLGPSAEPTRDGAALRFPAARGRAVAVFLRGETLWIVLEGHPALDPATLLSPLVSLIDKAEAPSVPGAAVLKLVLKAPLLASISENEMTLSVNLSRTAAAPPDSIALTRQGADGKTTLTASVPGADRVVSLEDKDAGDRLLIVPGRVGRGVLTPKRFVELQALPSAAGLALIPYTDDLSARVESEIVTLSRPLGLALSAASGANTTPVLQLEKSKDGPAFVDFAQWGQAQDANAYAAIHAMRAAIAKLPESQTNNARLRLARYLLAQELAPEAMGEVQLIQSADQKYANDPALEAMKGVAQFMMGRYTDARSTLSGGPLAADPHASFWRGMAEAKLGDWGDARRDLLASQPVLRRYPDAWQTRARLARAETGLAQGDLASANDALDQLSPELSPRASVETRLYQAKLLAAQGHMNEAISRLRALEGTDYPPIAAQATFARVETELNAKKIKPADAIETLEKLRFRWRGDDLELMTLRKLGSLYFADNKWREGLNVLRTAAVNFPNAELAREAQDDMRRAFFDLYLGGKADSMRPVEALALYYDFIELTPIGRDGDELIRRLSDKLVAVDLLAPAEQLLNHQVTQRLEGVARAVVATKLAMIYLMDHKPKEALAAISDTRASRLPEEIIEQRRLLEARALAGLKQFDAAVDLVADDNSPSAKRLRSDIYWESGNWMVAGAKTEDSLGERWKASTPLGDEERAEVMRAAVAYSLAGNDAALARLRERYVVKMNTSPDAKAFQVVTEKIDQQGVAFRDLAKQIASVDSLQAFMTEFKKQETAAAPKTAQN